MLETLASVTRGGSVEGCSTLAEDSALGAPSLGQASGRILSLHDSLCASKLRTLTLEVAFCRLAGDSTLVIAGNLAVSPSTVKRHLRAFRDWRDCSPGLPGGLRAA